MSAPHSRRRPPRGQDRPRREETLWRGTSRWAGRASPWASGSAYARDLDRRTMTNGMKEPRIAITDFALTRIEQVRANRKQPDAGVRIAITGRQDGAFSYDLSLVNPGEERDGDLVVTFSQRPHFTLP